MGLTLDTLEQEYRDNVLARIKISETLDVQAQVALYAKCKGDILFFFKYFLCTENKLANIKKYYKYNTPNIPFLLFPKQEEMVLSIWESIMEGTKPIDERTILTDAFIEKTRQIGASWIFV